MIKDKNSKIVMITMFKNESTVIKRMLDSCLPYVDYYVMQDNGSTDGTDDIAKQFLIENVIICLIAIGVGVLISYFLFLPGFNSLLPIVIPFSFSSVLKCTV